MRYSGNIVRAALPGASATGASGNWELEDAVQQIGSGAWPAAVGLNDPNFFRNALLLNGDGTNGAQNNTFLDSSTNNFTITRNGNTSNGSFTPFGGANYSAYFDGSSYLAATSSSAFDLSTGNFTIEFWFNAASVTAQSTIVEKRSGATFDWIFFITAGAAIQWYPGFDQATAITSSATVLANTWNHVAGVRTGSTFTLYLNGASVGTATSASAITYSAGAPVNIGYDNSTTARFYFSGYVSNVRIVKGSAVYTTAFTPSTAPLNTTSSTTLLTCASNTFEDLSATTATITRGGNSRVTEFSPFNSYNRTPASYGVALNGTTDFLTVASSANLGFGAADFTVEFWAYPTVNARQDWLDFTDGNNRALIYYTGTNIVYYVLPTKAAAITGSAPVFNQWNHIAVCRSGTSTRLFLNGVQQGSTFTDSKNYGTVNLTVGKDNAGSTYVTGNMSNIRLVKGTALYTANFTPPTAPLTAVSGTSLLICQDTTFKDNSTNAAAITVNGSARPVKANPFNYTIALGTGYSPVTMGGSAYFDGTGDFLNFTGGTATSLNADFTIEGWLYANSFAVTQIILCIGDDFANPGVAFYVGTDGKLGIFYGNARALTGTTVAAANTWHHVAFVRSGSTITGYLNGVPQGTVTNSSTFSGTTTYIGGELYNGTAGGRNNGYVAGLRLVKGTALYTSSFVPPQAPVTAVTNTQLLMNFANGGIIDYATGAAIETVSGAKINTTTKKYGTGSIAFNGTSDYLQLQSSPVFAFGTGDFTIEMWVYVGGSGAKSAFIDMRNGTTTAVAPVIYQETTGVLYYYAGSANQITGPVMSVNTWNHIAVSRSGTSTRMFLNGVQVGSTYTDSNNYILNAPLIGRFSDTAAGYLNGYIDDLRISRYARYTANFTPPTSALQIF